MRTHGCQVDKINITLSRYFGIAQVGSSNFGDYISLYQETQLCSSAVRLNIVVKHFKRCSCIQIKRGPHCCTCATISIQGQLYRYSKKYIFLIYLIKLNPYFYEILFLKQK